MGPRANWKNDGPSKIILIRNFSSETNKSSQKARLWWVRYCLLKSPLSRMFPPHFQWSLRPSPPSRASSQSVARPWWVKWRQGATVALKGFVCFGGANCWPLGRRIREGQGGAKGRSIKPPRSSKEEMRRMLETETPCSYNFDQSGVSLAGLFIQL